MRAWKTAGKILALLAVQAFCVFLIARLAVSAYRVFTAPELSYTIYLDPTGSDTNDGRTRDAPLASLARANDLLRLARPDADVEIRVAHGVYTAPPTNWTFFAPGHSITFLPVDDIGTVLDRTADRPVFQGTGDTGFWLTARLPASLAGTGSTFRFRNLRVQGYDRGAIALNGGITARDGLRVPTGPGLNGNTVTGMYFTQLGSAAAGGQDGYGAVDLVNSSQNVISDNYFVGLENHPDRASLLHGVYLAHHSRANLVRNNYFEKVSGDPVRARNDSNDNDIFGNVFQQTGQAAQFSDWFCDAPCAERESRARECSSHGNVFHDNKNVSGYAGGAIRNWVVYPEGLDYPGGPGCDNNGQVRVRTFGNT